MKKGPLFEAQLVEYLKASGLPATERRIMGGIRDRGDMAGIPDVCIEAKNSPDYLHKLAGWLDEANQEAVNAKATIGLLWHKRKGKGSPGDCYVTMSGRTAVLLILAWLREQGK